MSRAITVALTIAILAGPSGFAQDRSAVPEQPRRVGVRLWVAQTITSKRMIQSVKDEAWSIWAPYGVELAWIDRGAAEPPPFLINVSLERASDDHDRQDSSPAVLGQVLVAPDDPAPYPVRVSFDATREILLRRRGPGRVGLVPEQELARALGRVIAHEIGHVLIGTSYHDTAGLMRTNFSADLLAGVDRSPFHLSCATLERVRTGLTR